IDVEHERFVSFSRKEQIDPIIEQLSEWKDQIVDITLGPFVVLNQVLPVKLTVTPQALFNYSNDGVSFEPPSTSDYSCFFLDERLDSQLYAGVTSFNELTTNSKCSILNETERKARKTNFNDKIQFEKLGVFMLAFFLIALIRSEE